MVWLLFFHRKDDVGFTAQWETGLVPEAECALQECVPQGVDGVIVYWRPEHDSIGLEHLIPDLPPVVLFFADIIGGASEASMAALDGLAPEADVFGGFPGFLDDVLEEVIGDPLDENVLVVPDGYTATGVYSQNHGMRAHEGSVGLLLVACSYNHE